MKVPGLLGKAVRFVWWRLYLRYLLLWARFLLPWADRLAARWGWGARRLRWMILVTVPYRRRKLHILRSAGLGDVLLCTPALRELKQYNPVCHVTFYTDFPGLVADLPFIDKVLPSGEAPGDAIWLSYEMSLPPRRHLARIMGDHLGLGVRDVRPSCVIDDAERDHFREAWKDLPRPWIVINRHASGFTPNKEWPEEYWESLIGRLTSWASVIEIGQIPHPRPDRDPERYLSLIGRTNLNQLVSAVAAADLHVGPVSGPVHFAAAAGKPSVVIYGGYEHPDCSGYPGNINLYTPVPCAPMLVARSLPLRQEMPPPDHARDRRG